MRWFAGGFLAGLLLVPVVDHFRLSGDWLLVAAPMWWVFDANPVTLVACEVLERADLCIGLGLDGGPLEALEHAWLYVSLGLMYGALALGLRYIASVLMEAS
jgi:hypothetical protein